MIFYGKTFSEKVLEAKGRKYDELKRRESRDAFEVVRLEAEVARLKKLLKEAGK